jgi:hypothetical protein
MFVIRFYPTNPETLTQWCTQLPSLRLKFASHRLKTEAPDVLLARYAGTGNVMEACDHLGQPVP